MFWTVRNFPTCTHHVFLSHSNEDRDSLVIPAYRALVERGVVPWLDRHDYPYGRGSRAALRDSIPACRHVVFFVTPAMLDQARGWRVQELAWTELLQDNLVRSGGPLANVFLPLYLVPHGDDRLPRSVWQAVRDRGVVWGGATDRLTWAVDQIVAFLRREQTLSDRFRAVARRDEDFRHELKARELVDRVTRFDPQPLPPAPS